MVKVRFHAERRRLVSDIFKDIGIIIFFAAVVIGNFVPAFKGEINMVKIIWGQLAVVSCWILSYSLRPNTGSSDD